MSAQGPLNDARELLAEIEAAYRRDRATAKGQLRARYAGRHARFALVAEEVREDDEGRAFLVMVPPGPRADGVVLVFFGSGGENPARGFPLGAQATIEGRVTRVVRGGIFLEDCAIVGDPEDRGGGAPTLAR
ncbi:MAG: hypothetical protein D6729_13195 [Deltaproteobacteria bacterium]|nr:MAG: hypothetical protein D6729_13195 [Deltaproteobacteria bacterium]